MKQLTVFPLILLFGVVSIAPLSGQNYRAVQSDQIAHFEDENGDVQSLRIDSVSVQGDSVLYPFAVIQDLDYNCFSPSHASWIGEKVILRDEGIYLFINKVGDTITLQSLATPGDQWEAFYRADTFSITATVTDHREMEFLGMSDSVKTVAFQANDLQGHLIDHPVNSLEVQLSQHYGFVKSLNFAVFPDLNGGMLEQPLKEYQLAGLSDPKVGIQNLTWREAHDFQVGDVLHVREESRCWPNPGQTTITKSIYTYLERTDLADSIVYRYALRQRVEFTDSEGDSVDYIEDTLSRTIRPNPSFDQLPGEPVLENQFSYQYYMNADYPLSKTNAIGYESFYPTEDSCWGMTFVDGCLRDDTYMKGLGGPYYFCTHSICNGIQERKLVYYEKADTVWGTPLDLTSAPGAGVAKSLKVYPNPASEQIYIEMDEGTRAGHRIGLYDLRGREVKSQIMAGPRTQVNIADVPPGVYFVQVLKEGRSLHREKVVIE